MLRKPKQMVSLGNIKGMVRPTRFDHRGNLKSNKQQTSDSTTVLGQDHNEIIEDDWIE